MMSRVEWQAVFDGAAADGVLTCPGTGGLLVLYESNGLKSTLPDLQSYFDKHELAEDYDFRSSDWFG